MTNHEQKTTVSIFVEKNFPDTANIRTKESLQQCLENFVIFFKQREAVLSLPSADK